MSAGVRRDGEALVFEGALERAAVPSLWRQLQEPLTGVTRIDLEAVRTVDSAGLAMLAELAARLPDARLQGEPPGLAELREAYRLAPSLAFAR